MTGVDHIPDIALYRHFASKQKIYDKILEKMTELDAERAQEDNVPVETKEAQADSYENRSFHEFCCFAVNQFDFWTKNEFAVAFRKMLMLEQYKSPEKMKQYQEMICEGPVKYSEDEFLQIILTPFLQIKKNGDEAFCFFCKIVFDSYGHFIVLFSFHKPVCFQFFQ